MRVLRVGVRSSSVGDAHSVHDVHLHRLLLLVIDFRDNRSLTGSLMGTNKQLQSEHKRSLGPNGPRDPITFSSESIPCLTPFGFATSTTMTMSVNQALLAVTIRVGWRLALTAPMYEVAILVEWLV